MRAAAVTGARGVTLTEWPFVTMVNLRVDPASEAADRIEKALGAPLPRQCGDTAAAGPHTVVWLGPDEWLVLSQAAEAAVRPPRCGRRSERTPARSWTSRRTAPRWS